MQDRIEPVRQTLTPGTGRWVVVDVGKLLHDSKSTSASVVAGVAVCSSTGDLTNIVRTAAVRFLTYYAHASRPLCRHQTSTLPTTTLPTGGLSLYSPTLKLTANDRPTA